MFQAISTNDLCAGLIVEAYNYYVTKKNPTKMKPKKTKTY